MVAVVGFHLPYLVSTFTPSFNAVSITNLDTSDAASSSATPALIKSEYPNVYYVIYFSSKPKHGSYSDEMINTALKHGIVNEVRYERDITYLLKQMVLKDANQ